MTIIKFSPRDDDIIRNYLLPKVLGHSSNIHDHIVEEKIYSLAPSSLNWNQVPHLYDHERYYFAKRSPVQVQLNNNNRYYCDNGGGFWKSSGDKFPIIDSNSNNRILGYYRTLNFWHFKDSIVKDRRRVFKSQWLMHEYQLPQHEFQEWAFCRVKDESKERKRTSCRNDHDDQVLVIPPKQDHDQVQIIPPKQGVHRDESLQYEQQQPLDLPDHYGKINDDEFDYERFVASLLRVQSQMPPHHTEEDVLIPNLQITRGLIEPPSSLFYPNKSMR